MDAKRHAEIGKMLDERVAHGYGTWHRALVDCLASRGVAYEDQPEVRTDRTQEQWRAEVGHAFRAVKPEGLEFEPELTEEQRRIGDAHQARASQRKAADSEPELTEEQRRAAREPLRVVQRQTAEVDPERKPTA